MAEVNQRSDRPGERHEQAWEVDFSDEFRLVDETETSPANRLGKIVPRQNGRKGEDRIGNVARGRHFGKFAKHNSEDEDGEYRLDNRPGSAQCGLLDRGPCISRLTNVMSRPR